MKPTVFVYGRFHTTAYMFIHVLKRLLDHHRPARDYRYHLVLDDRRDLPLAQALLPPDDVTVEAQFTAQSPFEGGRDWPAETVARWEAMYGDPNLRMYMRHERALARWPEAMRWNYLFTQIEYFERRCETLRPVLFLSGAADGLSTWVAMTIMRARGVSCASFSPCRFGPRSFVLDNPYEVLRISDRYRELLAEGLAPAADRTVRELRAEYQKAAVKPVEYTAFHAKRRRLVPNPMSAVRLIREGRTDARNFDQSVRDSLGRAITARRSWLRAQLLQRRALRPPFGNEPFFFFPLHLEPESSLITQGRGWTDQLALLRLLSKCLPVDRRLYVKEHPSMLPGIRPLGYYKAIQSLPGVRLLDQRVPSSAILPHAEAVVTITGTAGWEALMFGKPVVLFGHGFYEEFAEAVTVVDDVEELPATLRGLRSRTVPERALLAYMAAVMERAPEGIITEPRLLPALAPLAMSDDNLDKVARIILGRLDSAAPALA